MRPFAFLLALALALPSGSGTVEAKGKVDIVTLTVVDADAPSDLERRVRRAIHHAAEHSDFGKRRGVALDVKVTRYDVEIDDDFARVTCTIVGRLKSGKVAKSHLSFGGRAAKRKKLEAQVISAVADGLVNRLAHLVKEDAASPPPRPNPPGASGHPEASHSSAGHAPADRPR